jgi:hypothetical protein
VQLGALQPRHGGGAIIDRIAALDWRQLGGALDEHGFTVTGPLLEPSDCRALIDAYAAPERFRSRVVMARHNFGRGEYQYFAYPLPGLVDDLRAAIYPYLASIANRWAAAMKSNSIFAPTLAEMLERCHAKGQCRPTPLILKYGAGDYNCLHQDLYGELYFPLQIAVLLSRPTEDFTGGEFVLTEQRPRMQSRAHVVPLREGEGVIFAVNERPVCGKRGYYRVKMRHGVSEIQTGARYTLGVIFHDAA